MVVRLGHYRPSIGAAHRSKAALDEITCGNACFARAAAEPEHGPPGAAHQIGKRGEQTVVRCRRSDRPNADMPGPSGFFPRHVDRNFERDRPARRRERGARSGLDHGHGGSPLPDPEIGL